MGVGSHGAGGGCLLAQSGRVVFPDLVAGLDGGWCYGCHCGTIPCCLSGAALDQDGAALPACSYLRWRREWRELVGAIEADADTDIRILGVFDDRLSEQVSVQHQRYPTLGPLSALISMVRSTRIDLVIVALPLSAQDRIMEAADELS